MSTGSVQQVPFNSYTPNVAIVTGGAQGIGYAVAHRLADDGLNIAINDIPEKRELINSVVDEIRKKGRQAIAVPGDVSSEADVSSMVEKTAQELGSVDVMIANAGIVSPSPLFQTSVANFDRVLAINVRGVFLCFKHAASQMVKQGRGGRLLAATSIMGRQGDAMVVAYSASKFAIRGIAQSVSAELRNYGITVNTYAPGPIRTPLLLSASQEAEETTGTPASHVIVGEPEDVASAVSYLAKPEAYHINGQCITIDGGFIRS